MAKTRGFSVLNIINMITSEIATGSAIIALILHMIKLMAYHTMRDAKEGSQEYDLSQLRID